MAHPALVSLGLAALVAASPVNLLAQTAPQPDAQAQSNGTPPPAEVAPPSDTPAAGAVTPPADAQPTPPADQATPPPDGTTPPMETAQPAAETAPAKPAKSTPKELAPLGTRLLMDVVTGAAGGAVVLALGLVVATPLALLPWLLPAVVSSTSVLGVPASLLITGGLVAMVLAGSVGLSAVVQRFVRPLIGQQPSFLGAILGSVFFGGVGAAVGLVASYLLVTVPPDPFRGVRNQIFGDLDSKDRRALAITGALVVGLAVPLAAIGAAIGGPVSAEVEDKKAVEGSVE